MQIEKRLIISKSKQKSLRFDLNKVKEYLLSLVLAFVAIIQLYPLIWLLLFSLKNNGEIFGGNVLGFPKKWL